MLIRGENRENPILLFLHGGPGFSEMPTYPRNADLEKDFVVVQWDQRGAGKSFRPTTPPESMAVAQFVSDTHELTEKLCEKFNRRKVILVGFSFGSLVGLQAVEQRPDLYHAYVGLSHFITIPESEAILDQEGRERARKQNRPELLAELETIGPPPYDGKKPERRVNAIIKELVSEKVDNPFPDIEYIGKSMLSKYYFFPDFVSLAFGRSFSGKHMKTELYTIDIRDHVKAIDVPTLWISGRYDTTISQTLARGFFDDLHAPSGKKWVWFETPVILFILKNPLNSAPN